MQKPAWSLSGVPIICYSVLLNLLVNVIDIEASFYAIEKPADGKCMHISEYAIVSIPENIIINGVCHNRNDLPVEVEYNNRWAGEPYKGPIDLYLIPGKTWFAVNYVDKKKVSKSSPVMELDFSAGHKYQIKYTNSSKSMYYNVEEVGYEIPSVKNSISVPDKWEIAINNQLISKGHSVLKKEFHSSSSQYLLSLDAKKLIYKHSDLFLLIDRGADHWSHVICPDYSLLNWSDNDKEVVYGNWNLSQRKVCLNWITPDSCMKINHIDTILLGCNASRLRLVQPVSNNRKYFQMEIADEQFLGECIDTAIRIVSSVKNDPAILAYCREYFVIEKNDRCYKISLGQHPDTSEFKIPENSHQLRLSSDGKYMVYFEKPQGVASKGQNLCIVDCTLSKLLVITDWPSQLDQILLWSEDGKIYMSDKEYGNGIWVFDPSIRANNH